MILRIFSFTYIILFRAPFAPAIPTPSLAQIGSPLWQGDHTDACFFTFIRMFTQFTTLTYNNPYILIPHDLLLLAIFLNILNTFQCRIIIRHTRLTLIFLHRWLRIRLRLRVTLRTDRFAFLFLWHYIYWWLSCWIYFYLIYKIIYEILIYIYSIDIITT